jgi:hypothetical protein
MAPPSHGAPTVRSVADRDDIPFDRSRNLGSLAVEDRERVELGVETQIPKQDALEDYHLAHRQLA